MPTQNPSDAPVPYEGNVEYHQDFGQPRAFDPGMDVGAAVRAAKEAGLVNIGGIDPEEEALAAQMAEAVGSGKRAFVSPANKKSHILIKAGVVRPCYPNTDEPIVAGAPSQNGVEMRRIGDVFIDFSGGIAILDPDDPEDALRIQWCEANPQIARDCMDPQVEQWAQMKTDQLDLSWREGSNKGLDVDRVLAGDFTAFAKSDSLAARARAILAGKAG